MLLTFSKNYFFQSKIPKSLVFAKALVLNIRSGQASTLYSNNNQIDLLAQRYEVNCTGFINHVIASTHPHAMEEIKEYIRETQDYKGYPNGLPRCLQYYRFLESKKPKQYWESVTRPQELVPGDLIVCCENTERITKGGQHIMMVSEVPKASALQNCLVCPIYDSSGGHGSHDKRISGIEEGEIVLKVDDAQRLIAFKWSAQSDTFRAPQFSMARIRERNNICFKTF